MRVGDAAAVPGRGRLLELQGVGKAAAEATVAAEAASSSGSVGKEEDTPAKRRRKSADGDRARDGLVISNE